MSRCRRFAFVTIPAALALLFPIGEVTGSPISSELAPEERVVLVDTEDDRRWIGAAADS